MKTKASTEIPLLRQALRLAAVEAYVSEVIETEMYDLLIGTDKTFPTRDFWIQDRIDYWIEMAELSQIK